MMNEFNVVISIKLYLKIGFDLDVSEAVFLDFFQHCNIAKKVFIRNEVMNGMIKALVYRINEGIEGDHWRFGVCYKFYCALVLSMVLKVRNLGQKHDETTGYIIRYITKSSWETKWIDGSVGFRDNCVEEGCMLDEFESALEDYDAIVMIVNETIREKRMVFELVKDWVQGDIEKLYEMSARRGNPSEVILYTDEHNHGILCQDIWDGERIIMID